MISAALFAVILEHPDSVVRAAVSNELSRRALMGGAMGGTAIAIIYSRLGARSGAQLNPAVTLTFARLGTIAPRDAAAYIAAQFMGALAGLGLAALVLGQAIANPAVHYVATEPGRWGRAAAFSAEAAMAFVMMTAVLWISNGPRARWTGMVAGGLVATYIVIEAPVSGMSLNPARSLAPALLAGSFRDLWIYFTAPLAGMALAGDLFIRTRGAHAVRCAKLNHSGPGPCLFRCRVGVEHSSAV